MFGKPRRGRNWWSRKFWDWLWQGNLSFNAIVLPDSNAVRYVLKRRGWKMIGRRNQWGGGKGGQKVTIDFYIHSDFVLKKALFIFSGKGGPDATLKKSFKNRKIQNIMMTWTVQCIREGKNCVQMKCTNFL